MSSAANVEQPADKIVYWCFCVAGCGFLLPWNALIAAVDYFNGLFPGGHLEFKLAFAYMIPNFLVMFAFGAITAFHCDNSYTKSKSCVGVTLRNVYLRMYAGFLLLLFVLLTTPFVTSESMLILMAVLTGCGDATVQVTVYGFAGAFPAVYTAAVMSGNGIAGLSVVLLRMVTKLAYSSDSEGLRSGARLYFFLSATVILACLAGTWHLSRSTFVKQYYSGGAGKTGRERSSSVAHSDGVELIDSHTHDSDTAGVDVTHETEEAHVGSPSDSHRVGTSDFPSDKAVAPHGDTAAHVLTELLCVLREISPYAFSVFLVFLVTLMLFPGVTGELTSQYNSGDWFSVLLVADFMLFDFIARSLPSFSNAVWFSSEKAVLKWSLCRVIFVPLLVLGLYAQRRDSLIPAFLGDDVWLYLVVAVFAFSNGYCANIAMMFAPRKLQRKSHQELAGTLMALSLVTGLTVGASLGMAIEASL